VLNKLNSSELHPGAEATIKLVLLVTVVVACLSFSAFAQDAAAQMTSAAAAVPAPSGMQKLFAMVPMFVMVFFIFYFMVQLPEQKEQKAHAALMRELQKSDEVVTNFGLFGRVAGIEKDYILLEVSTGVKIKIDPSSIKNKVA
jgi:preprotein translocase subunit YajC